MNHLIFILLISCATMGFGQNIISEEIAMTNGEINIPGELTMPKTVEKVPLVIFVHGSGNVDRNGNQAPVIKANYIKLLADRLNYRGIAFYRYDKRTSIKENLSKLSNIRFEDLVTDVQVIIEHFKYDNRFSGIHLIGHSQGSLVGMLATDQDVKSYISLAGPGETIRETIVRQVSVQNKELGNAAKAHLKELKETDTIKNVSPFLMQLFAPQNQKFIKSWMAYNPSEEIKKLKLPLLIIQGAMDSQVTLEDANHIYSASYEATKDIGITPSLIIIEDMNHVLKTVKNQIENQSSYFDPDYPISEQLVEELVYFINTNG